MYSGCQVDSIEGSKLESSGNMHGRPSGVRELGEAGDQKVWPTHSTFIVNIAVDR